MQRDHGSSSRYYSLKTITLKHGGLELRNPNYINLELMKPSGLWLSLLKAEGKGKGVTPLNRNSG